MQGERSIGGAGVDSSRAAAPIISAGATTSQQLFTGRELRIGDAVILRALPAPRRAAQTGVADRRHGRAGHGSG